MIFYFRGLGRTRFGRGLIRGSLVPIGLVVGEVLLAGPTPPTSTAPLRTVVLRVVDRLDRPVQDVTACLLPECAKVALRAGKDGFVSEVLASERTLLLRLSARSFEPAEVKLAPGATAVEATLTAKGSVRVSFLAVDEKRSGKLTVSLKETVDPRAGTRGRLLVERAVTLEPRPAQNAAVLEEVPPGDWVLGWEGPSLAACLLYTSPSPRD